VPKSPSRNTSLKGAAAPSRGSPAASTAAPSPSLGATAAAPDATSGQSVPKRAPVAPKIPELVSGHYLLDFGCVTKGINKSRKVKLTNMSTQQVGANQQLDLGRLSTLDCNQTQACCCCSLALRSDPSTGLGPTDGSGLQVWAEAWLSSGSLDQGMGLDCCLPCLNSV
jgi:hypothetical protein